MTPIGSPAVPGSRRPKLLLIEDDDSLRRGLQLFLHGQGFDVHAFASSRSALADPSAAEAPFVVTDYMLPEQDGISALVALRERGWKGVAVMITAFVSPALHAKAAATGFAAVVDKPFRQDDLLRLLRR